MRRTRSFRATALTGVLGAALLVGGGPVLGTGSASAAASVAPASLVPASLVPSSVAPASVAPASVGPRATAARAICATPFTASFVASLARDFPRQRVTASVHDTRTGCWYELHPGLRITTASTIKASVMGAVLLRAQDRRRGLTAWERHRIRPMITYSYNNPYVSDLLYRVGGVRGMNRFDRRMGATRTTNSLAYGATWTTARDRTRIALGLLHPGGPLKAAGRTEAWRYLTGVTPTQRWGITAGVPSGWQVALKNGFYPMRGYGWRVGSTGFVRRAGSAEGYAVTVLTDRNTSQVSGIRVVERVSRRVAAALTDGAAVPRVVDRSRCVTARSGQTWRQVAVAVGRPARRWADVRRVSGGNPTPLRGQRACSPSLRPRT
jgi:beta-lactamase class A